MLERNFLSHFKLAILLSLLSWSILLEARLVPEKPNERGSAGGVPLSAIGYGAAVACVAAGCWEYYQGYWDLRNSVPFLRATKYVLLQIDNPSLLMFYRIHLTIMGIVAAVVFGICIALVVKD